MHPEHPDYTHLSPSRQGDVGTCETANPPRHTLTAAGVIELSDPVRRLSEDRSVRVLACFERAMRSADAAGAMRAWLEGRAYAWRGE